MAIAFFPALGPPIADCHTERDLVTQAPLMSGKRQKMKRKEKVEQDSITALELSTSEDDLPIISESVKLLIKPLFDALAPDRRTVANLQDALDLAKEGWNLHVELGDDREDLPAELATRSAQFVGRGLPAEIGRQLLELLMARKRTLFPGDDRLIIKAQALERAGGLRVMVTWGRYAKVH